MSFDIKIIKKSSTKHKKAFVVSGFLTNDSGKDEYNQWVRGLEEAGYEDFEINYVNWPSSTVKENLVTAVSKLFLIFQRSPAAPYISLLAKGYQLYGLGKHWRSAADEAEKAGEKLAEKICTLNEDAEIVLLGHSLGSRLIVSSLEVLSSRDREISEVHLLAGAVDTNKNWHDLQSIVKNGICNYYSKKDRVLQFLFRIGEGSRFKGVKAIGRREVSMLNNSADTKKGHTKYIPNLSMILMKKG